MRPDLLSALFAVVAILMASTGASARTESLRWHQPEADEVDGYRVHLGTSSRSYVATIQAAGVTTGSDGAINYTVTVPDSLAASTLYVAVTAFDSSGSSPYSNEKVFQGPPPPGPDPDPDPDPDPGPGGAQSGIDGFRLWNGTNDSLIGDLESGDQIDLAAVGTCTAIEILGNAYLQIRALPGSIGVSFDGDSTCDNTAAPYAWEPFTNGPGDFSCASALAEPGVHTLRVTPYDGDNCSGTAGSDAVLTFEVLDTSPPPANEEALGAPGRPFLIE